MSSCCHSRSPAADNSRKSSAAEQSSNINLAGTSQLTAPLMTRNMMMPFGDNSMVFFQPIQGEFTNLLLQAHHELPTARRLDFDK
ncbi:unnamed protein product [Urochloa humidicola]